MPQPLTSGPEQVARICGAVARVDTVARGKLILFMELGVEVFDEGCSAVGLLDLHNIRLARTDVLHFEVVARFEVIATCARQCDDVGRQGIVQLLGRRATQRLHLTVQVVVLDRIRRAIEFDLVSHPRTPRARDSGLSGAPLGIGQRWLEFREKGGRLVVVR